MRVRSVFPALLLLVLTSGFSVATADPPKPTPGSLVNDHPGRVPASAKPPKGPAKPYKPGPPADRNPCHVERYVKLDAKIAELSGSAEGRATLAKDHAAIKAVIMAGCD